MLADPTPAITPSTEAYRIAKLNFTNTLDTTSARIIMFTSASEQDGTSPTLANLALVLAQSGQHVILLDANLRDPVQPTSSACTHPSALATCSAAAPSSPTYSPRSTSDRTGSTAASRPMESSKSSQPAAPPTTEPHSDTRAAGELLRALRTSRHRARRHSPNPLG